MENMENVVLFGHTFPFKSRLSIEVGKGAIAPFAQNSIIKTLATYNYRNYEDMNNLHSWNREKDFLPEDWEWVWQTEDGRKLTSRVKEVYQKMYNHRLRSEVLQEIGNIAAQYRTDEALTFEIEFAPKLDWNRGDFGDPQSCFWSQNRRVHDEFNNNEKLFAVKFFTADDQGMGRSLLYRAKEDLLYIFNSYGMMTPYVTSLLRNLLGLTDNEEYMMLPRYRFYFDGSPQSLLWVNNSGHAGVLCRTDEYPPPSEYLTEVIRRRERERQCTRCEEWFPRSSVMMGANGGNYCRDCYQETHVRCHDCGLTLYLPDYDTYSDEGYGIRCIGCHENVIHRQTCPRCYEEYDDRWERSYEHEDYDEEVCEDCAYELFTVVCDGEGCHNTIYLRATPAVHNETSDGRWLCAVCQPYSEPPTGTLTEASQLELPNQYYTVTDGALTEAYTYMGDTGTSTMIYVPSVNSRFMHTRPVSFHMDTHGLENVSVAVRDELQSLQESTQTFARTLSKFTRQLNSRHPRIRLNITTSSDTEEE